MGAAERQEVVGCDMSASLVQICAERGFEVCVCDNMSVPFRSGVFDAAISIAVLHHFSSDARRRRALTETARLLRPGGRLLVYAWALEQGTESKRRFPEQVRPLSHRRTTPLRRCFASLVLVARPPSPIASPYTVYQVGTSWSTESVRDVGATSQLTPVSAPQDVLVPWHHFEPEEEVQGRPTAEHGTRDEARGSTVYQR